MASIGICALAAALASGVADERIELRETAKAGAAARVLIELKAEGAYKPDPPGGAAAKEPVKPIPLKVEGRNEFVEKVLTLDDAGRPRRVVRRVEQAASAVNNELRRLADQARPEVSLLVAERRPAGVVVWSVGGPLTRSELELVQGPADPLALGALLPGKAMAVGERWAVGDEAARALSEYDAITSNKLEAKLTELTAEKATLRIGGDLRGSARGGEGAMRLAGTATFDRRTRRIDRLDLKRAENRRSSPVEWGLEAKSTLTVEVKPIDLPAELADDALKGISTDPAPQRELLTLKAPGGKGTLVHDRDWYLSYDDPRRAVLKRVEKGEVVAQCNLTQGPSAGKGRHQDVAQFRDELRQALGKRFGEFLSTGEVEGADPEVFRYRIAARGMQGELGVIWYYYLVAGPEGDQLIVTFTLAEVNARRFGDQDLQLIGSLEWADPADSPRRQKGSPP